MYFTITPTSLNNSFFLRQAELGSVLLSDVRNCAGTVITDIQNATAYTVIRYCNAGCFYSPDSGLLNDLLILIE